jgi:hypothetical protein
MSTLSAAAMMLVPVRRLPERSTQAGYEEAKPKMVLTLHMAADSFD